MTEVMFVLGGIIGVVLVLTLPWYLLEWIDRRGKKTGAS